MELYTKIFLFTLSLCVNIASWMIAVNYTDKNNQKWVVIVGFIFIMWTQIAILNYLSSL